MKTSGALVLWLHKGCKKHCVFDETPMADDHVGNYIKPVVNGGSQGAKTMKREELQSWEMELTSFEDFLQIFEINMAIGENR